MMNSLFYQFQQIDPINNKLKTIKTVEELEELIQGQGENWNNYKDLYGADHYLLSIYYGNYDIMKHLETKYEWDTKVKDKTENNAYLYACMSGNIDIIKHIEDNNSCNIFARSTQGDDAMLLASKKANMDVITHLREKHNWSLNVKNSTNYGVYALGVINGTIEFLEYLDKFIEDKSLICDISQVTHTGYNIGQLAILSKKLEILQHIEKIFDKQTVTAALSGYSPKGDSAYLLAIQTGKIEIVRHLEENYNFNIYHLNNSGTDAYLMAAAINNFEIFKHLEEKHQHIINQYKVLGEDPDQVFGLGDWHKKNKMIQALQIASANSFLSLNMDVANHLIKKFRLFAFKLDKETIHELDQSTCAICHDEFNNGDEYCLCEKKHGYHKDCYMEYLQENNINENFKCPYCDKKMFENSFKIKPETDPISAEDSEDI